MKELVKASQPIGGDGAMANESVVIDNGFIKASVDVSFPIANVLKPANDAIDKVEAELLKVIPGDVWDKAILDPIFAGAKAELAKLISGL